MLAKKKKYFLCGSKRFQFSKSLLVVKQTSLTKERKDRRTDRHMTGQMIGHWFVSCC